LHHLQHFNLATLSTLVGVRISPSVLYKFRRLTCTGYTPWVNTLDYTSVVFPVTQVDKTVDLYDKDYQPWSEQDKTNWEQCKSTLFE